MIKKKNYITFKIIEKKLLVLNHFFTLIYFIIFLYFIFSYYLNKYHLFYLNREIFQYHLLMI